MSVVQLIVTGDLEKRTLPVVLKTLFPDHTFDVQKVHEVTTCRLPAVEGPTPSAIHKFAAALVAAFEPGQRRRDNHGIDFVFGLADLEVDNVDQPEIVQQWIIRAIGEILSGWGLSQSTQQRVATQLQERCSVHFFTPMIEAYFFGAKRALLEAGVHAKAEARLSNTNVEQFLTTDDRYKNWHEANVSAAKPSFNWYAQHPKRYLEFLGDFTYVETVHGSNALRSVKWSDDFANPNETTFARAFLQDLADALSERSPMSGQAHPITAYPTRRRSPTLRNA